VSTMICRACADISGPWLRLQRVGADWVPEAHFNLLQPAIETTLLVGDFTFTTRPAPDAVATYAESPEQLQGLGLNSHAVILCPEGPPVEDRWVTLHRVPITGACVGADIKDRFRPKPEVLKQQIVSYFERQQWRSFAAPKVSERHEPVGQQPQRPSHHRELLIRPNWSARQIAPQALGPLNRNYYPEVA
jgi:hypothetical protein